MVYHQLIQVLSKEGVEEIPALGEILIQMFTML